MGPFLLALNCGLFTAAFSSAARISKPSLLLSSAVDALPTVNLTTPDGRTLQSGNSSLGAEDPRFFVLVRDGTEDLSDKSVFMAVLRALGELAKHEFDEHIHGGEWSAPGYDDVAVVIPPHPRLQVRFAMWGLAGGVAHMHGKGYPSVEVHLYFNGGRGVGPVEVGIIQILKRHPIHRRAETGPETLSLTTQLPANSTAPGNTSIFGEGGVSSVEIPNYNLRTNFRGVRLSTYGVFVSIFASINEVASMDRSKPLEVRADIRGGSENVGLIFRPWVFQPYGPPYLYYDQMLWMFDRAVKYMIRNNRFNAGEFVLLVDNEPVGFGEFHKLQMWPVALKDEK
ncbi:MAG: hypothetical protein L6R38_004604 [Xanthoria sp. 2 TBL-2021]|nr:MAG: hypothetical protein L6R38_004604 [Xanthoria sp. 2 TBL-2021]